MSKLKCLSNASKSMRTVEIFFMMPDETRITIPCHSIEIENERRLQRTILRGGEGDDLQDEGSESNVYTIGAVLDEELYIEYLGMFEGDQPMMFEPMEKKWIKVAFRKLNYDVLSQEFVGIILHDID